MSRKNILMIVIIILSILIATYIYLKYNSWDIFRNLGLALLSIGLIIDFLLNTKKKMNNLQTQP